MQYVLGNHQCDFSHHRTTNKTVTSAESQTDLPAFERCSQPVAASCCQLLLLLLLLLVLLLLLLLHSQRAPRPVAFCCTYVFDLRLHRPSARESHLEVQHVIDALQHLQRLLSLVRGKLRFVLRLVGVDRVWI